MTRAPAQTLALLFGAVFVAVGVLGFVPGITTDYGEMTFAGDGSASQLVGVFQVSILHNIVHLLFGVAGLRLGRTREGARTYLVGGGIAPSCSGCSASRTAPTGSRPTTPTTGSISGSAS